MSHPSPNQAAFERATLLTVVWAVALLVWIYSVAFPTPDLRARIPWLLGRVPVVVPIFAVLGSLAVTVAGVRLRPSLGGILAGSILGYLLVASGVLNVLLPASHDTPARPVLAVVSTAVAGVALWRERQRPRPLEG